MGLHFFSIFSFPFNVFFNYICYRLMEVLTAVNDNALDSIRALANMTIMDDGWGKRQGENEFDIFIEQKKVMM